MEAVILEDIGKKYIIKHEKGAFVKDVLPRIFIPKEEKEFWALKNINLRIEEGECFGILGRNGAGKSTLLNIIAGITFPTTGKVKVKGKLSTILTLGAGFHPELSGIDNIYLNGVILGMKIREIKNRLNKIIDFSELKEFINQPLYTYSSGMILRLGFSIAVYADFDILLIDEIISVGDLYFQEKCLKKIAEFKKEGKTLLIASQSLDLIKDLCDKAILLEKGEIVLKDVPERVCERYLEIVKRKEELSQYPVFPKYPEDIEKIKIGWGSCRKRSEVDILEVNLKGENKKRKNEFKIGESFEVEVKYKVNKEIFNPHFGVAIFREDYLYVYGPNTEFDGINIKRLKPGIGKFSIIYYRPLLASGNYCLSIAIWDKEEKNPYAYHYAYYRFKIEGEIGKDYSLLKIPCFLKIKGKKIIPFKNYLYVKKQENKRDFIRIKEIKIFSKWGREKKEFRANESVKIILELEMLKDIYNPIIWIGLYLEKNILITESIFEIKETLSAGRNKFLLFYPSIPLLRGNYSVNMRVYSSKNLEEFQYFPSIINFSFQTDKKDHGIVYLKHKWRLRNP